MTTRKILRKDIKKWSVEIYHRLKTDKAHHRLNTQGLFWKDGTEVPCLDSDCGLCQRYFSPKGLGCTTCPLRRVQGCGCSSKHSVSCWYEFYITPNRETAKTMIKILVLTLKELTP